MAPPVASLRTTWMGRSERIGHIVLAVALALSVTGCGAGASSTPEGRDKADTRVDLAKDFLRKGQLQPAAVEAERALEYHRRSEEAHNVLGLVRFFQALSNYRLLEVDACVTGVDGEALRAEMDEHLLAADRQFQRAVEIAPDYGEAWSNRGSVALKLGDAAAAVEYFDNALSYPARLRNAAVTRANLGWAYFKLGRHPQAAKELRQAAQFQPGMCLASYRLGRVYFAREEWEKALDTLEETASQDCPIQEAQLYRMKTYAELGRNEALREAGSDCVSMAPQSCAAARCRALVP